MEHEVERASWLGVSLIALAAFLSIVMCTVYMGNNLKGQAVDYGVDLVDSVATADLKDARGTEKDLPMAGIYTFLANNYEEVTVLGIHDLRGSGNDWEDVYAALNTASSASEPNLGNIYKTNTVGYWSINGEGSGKAYLMCYDILNANYLEGRGYLYTYKLSDGTYGVQIIIYK